MLVINDCFLYNELKKKEATNMKKLLIVITLLILTGCTPVSDDPINDIDLILNGDEEIILTIGDTYHDYEVANAIGCKCILLNNVHQKLDHGM